MVTTENVMGLLSKGVRFAPGTKLSHLMRAFNDELAELANQELQSSGYIEVRLHNGRLVRYTFDPATSAWQQVL